MRESFELGRVPHETESSAQRHKRVSFKMAQGPSEDAPRTCHKRVPWSFLLSTLQFHSWRAFRNLASRELARAIS